MEINRIIQLGVFEEIPRFIWMYKSWNKLGRIPTGNTVWTKEFYKRQQTLHCIFYFYSLFNLHFQLLPQLIDCPGNCFIIINLFK